MADLEGLSLEQEMSGLFVFTKKDGTCLQGVKDFFKKTGRLETNGWKVMQALMSCRLQGGD